LLKWTEANTPKIDATARAIMHTATKIATVAGPTAKSGT
jgi:hypothetical protein